MAREKGPYVNEHGVSLFDLVLDLYDQWLEGLPYVESNSGGQVTARAQPDLVQEVWPTVQQLCVRLEAHDKSDLAARVERAFRDAKDYARIIDNYCESEQFDYHLWTCGDPALDTIRTVEAEPTALLAQAEEIGECELTEDLHFTAFRRQWAADLGQRCVQIKVDKYSHPPTDDYALRTEMRAWACFWLAAQLHRKGLSHQEARGYLEQYLSSHVVVSETKYPVIHEALGRAYGMDIYPIAPMESEEVAQGLEGLPAVVLEIRDALALVEEPESPSLTPEVPWNPDDEDYVPAKDAVAHVKEINQDFDYGGLNKVLTRDGPMRHMRNPDKEEKGPGSVRCKVHKGDLETWCDGLRRAPTAKARPGGGKPAKPTHSGDGLYEKGFAEGHQEGYCQGYTAVKERKRYSCEPSFQDAPDDQYVHGLYEGWKAGYKEGRRDSENGEPQKHGARE